MPQVEGAMDLHVKVLAAFHLIFEVLGILGSLMVLLILGGTAGIISMAAPTTRTPCWRCRLSG